MEEAEPRCSTLEPEGLNGTNRMKLYVFGTDSGSRRGWWRCSTTSARAPRARRCRT